MKRILALTMLAAMTGCGTMPGAKPTVTLEFRPGSYTEKPGFTEMTVSGSDKRVYISRKAVLSNADVASARARTGPNGPQIEIVFTDGGTARFSQVTRDSIMKPIGILVDGKLISAPIVREQIRSHKAIISGSFSEEEARRIANGLAAQ